MKNKIDLEFILEYLMLVDMYLDMMEDGEL